MVPAKKCRLFFRVLSVRPLLGAEAIELRNWLLFLGYASEELMVVISRLSDWMSNYYPPWADYCALMACRLMALDKIPGVCPVGIERTLRWDLAKLIMRAARDQAKMSCGNLQICIGLESGMEGATHAAGQSILKRLRERRR